MKISSIYILYIVANVINLIVSICVGHIILGIVLFIPVNFLFVVWLKYTANKEFKKIIGK